MDLLLARHGCADLGERGDKTRPEAEQECLYDETTAPRSVPPGARGTTEGAALLDR